MLKILLKKQMAGNRATQKKLTLELKKSEEQLSKLQLEIGKTLTGDSLYSPEELTQAIKVLRERITQAKQQLAELQEEEASKQRGVEMITPAYNCLQSIQKLGGRV